MTKVKICGLTNEADARTALLAGADFLGFIFYPPSPRATTAQVVRALLQSLSADSISGPFLTGPERTQLVGVFVNETPQRIAEVMAHCGLDLAQLHGEEGPEVVNDPNLIGRAYQVVRPQTLATARDLAPLYAAPNSVGAPTLLIDAYHPALRGGTGETADWSIAAGLRDLTPRLMLAGGLNPVNVGAAVAHVRPFAVDVASGVEAAPGKKDPQKVRQFIDAVREAAR